MHLMHIWFDYVSIRYYRKTVYRFKYENMKRKKFLFFHFDSLISLADESFLSYLFCCQKSLGNQFKCIFWILFTSTSMPAVTVIICQLCHPLLLLWYFIAMAIANRYHMVDCYYCLIVKLFNCHCTASTIFFFAWSFSHSAIWSLCIDESERDSE